MAKEMNYFNYFPGDVTKISGQAVSNLLSRTIWSRVFINGFWLGGKNDNQRRTEFYYIYPNDALLGGR